MAKIMISLPDEFLKKVDRTAKTLGRSRSELIREALGGMLTGKEGGRRSWKETLTPLKGLEQQWVGRWDSTDIIRSYREIRYPASGLKDRQPPVNLLLDSRSWHYREDVVLPPHEVGNRCRVAVLIPLVGERASFLPPLQRGRRTSRSITSSSV